MRWVRWWLVFAGGALVGTGLVLHAQVSMAGYVRNEVQSVCFLWRGLAGLTFVFQDEVAQAALFLDGIPDHVLVESGRTAWTLTAIGAMLVLSTPYLRKGRRRRRRGALS